MLSFHHSFCDSEKYPLINLATFLLLPVRRTAFNKAVSLPLFLTEFGQPANHVVHGEPTPVSPPPRGQALNTHKDPTVTKVLYAAQSVTLSAEKDIQQFLTVIYFYSDLWKGIF